jgi:hypothetical protein
MAVNQLLNCLKMPGQNKDEDMDKYANKCKAFSGLVRIAAMMCLFICCAYNVISAETEFALISSQGYERRGGKLYYVVENQFLTVFLESILPSTKYKKYRDYEIINEGAYDRYSFAIEEKYSADESFRFLERELGIEIEVVDDEKKIIIRKD